MSQIDRAAFELREMDDLAMKVSPIHSLHPLVKLLVTAAYIVCTASFPKYDLSGLFPMILYPALIFPMSGIPVSVCLRKFRAVIPLLAVVGCFDLFLDRRTVFSLGNIPVTAGMVSFTVFFLKGILCLTASFLLAATTTLDRLCAALRMLGLPSALVTLFLLTFRYVSVMIDELYAMNTAYLLRAPGQKGIHYSVWGSFLGQLLLRSMDRAAELYESMQLRGFDGDMRYAGCSPFAFHDIILTAVSVGAIVFLRLVNFSRLLGGLFV